jgi:hypothetical protein
MTSSLSNFYDPLQKSRQLRRNLSESVWRYLPVLQRYKNEKNSAVQVSTPE